MFSNVLCELEILDHDFGTKSYARYAASLELAAKTAQNRLVVVLANDIFSISPSARATHFDDVQALLTFTYTRCVTAAQSASLDILVLLKGWSEDHSALGLIWDCILGNEIAEEQVEDTPSFPVVASASRILGREQDPSTTAHLSTPYPSRKYEVVSVNGTFDHFHAGHKNLITTSAWLACEKFVCAISHDQAALVARKSLALGLEDYSVRFKAVQAFLHAVVPRQLETVLLPVSAPYGQSTENGSVSAVVLSAESLHHRRRIQEIRTAANLAPVQFFRVDLVTGNVPPSRIHDDSWVQKISSSHIRRAQLPNKTFIFINGFVGVGKFTVARQLASFMPSARVIDNHLLLDPADALCPRTFPGYQQLRQQFRNVALKFLVESGSSSFIFTANCSISELGTVTAHQYEQAAEECGTTFIPVVLECGAEQVRMRVGDPARTKSSRFKLQDPDVALKIWESKEIFRFKTPNELCLETSHLTAEEVARKIYDHIQERTRVDKKM